MRLLFDTNVILDVLLARAPWLIDSATCWDAVSGGRVEGLIAASSFTDIFYIVRRQLGRDIAWRAVMRCSETFNTVNVGRLDIQHALASSGRDFEDNLQIAVASRLGCDFIVTRDLSDFASASVRPIHPAELAGMLRSDA